MAYSHLNNVHPSFLDIPCFYGMVATCFESLTTLMTILATKDRNGVVNNNLIFKKILNSESVSEKEMLVSGVMPTPTRKVS
jgi:hypothetical protein